MIFNGNIYAIIGIIVGIVHSILPMKEINKALISTNLSIENTHPYDEAKHNFATVKFYIIYNRIINFYIFYLFIRLMPKKIPLPKLVPC